MDFRALYLRKKFWIKDFISGSPIRKHFREIREIQTDSKGSIRTKKLELLLAYAQKNSQFYSNYTSLRLEDYPVMNKSKLISLHDEIVVEKDRIPGQIGDLHIQSTSGSTGTPFHIEQDTEKRRRRIAELKYFGQIVGFKTHDPLVQLRAWNRWQAKSARQSKQENIIPFDIANLGDERLADLCDTINKTHAVCLRSYASVYAFIARYVHEHNIKLPSLKIAIAGSEALTDDTRALFKKYVGCEIISQYANEECGIIAQERVPTADTDNPMYINWAGYFFEILKFDSDEPALYGEIGRIVLTDLNNYAFPVIRYDTGDAGIMYPPDKYSNGYPVLGKLFGRRFDICVNTRGEPIYPLAIGRVLKHYKEILQWQLVQKSEKEFLLKVIVGNKSTAYEYLNEAMVSLKGYLGEDANIIIEIVDGIPVLASGKRKPVVNEWKQVM